MSNNASARDNENRYTTEKHLWHNRLFHTMTLKTVRKSLKDGLLPHAECLLKDCEPCTRGKYRRRFTGSLTSSPKICLLHFYAKGPVICISVDGHKYFLTIIEEYFRFVYACPIRSKVEFSKILLRYVKSLEKQSGHTENTVHADNGTEFSHAFSVLSDDGVECTTITVHTL